MILKKYKEATKRKLLSLPKNEDGLAFWRRKIYYFLSLALVIFGFISYIPSVLFSIYLGMWATVFASTFVYSFILLLYFWKSLPFKFKVYGLLFVIYFLAIAMLLLVGSVGSGLIYLFALPVVAGILAGLRSTVVTICINTITIFTLGILLKMGMLAGTEMNNYTFNAWIVVGINFICINFIVSIPISVLINGLKFSVEEERKSRDMLFVAQLQILQQQLNPHFLFNTLNSLRSLIAIDKDRARGMVTDLSDFLRVTLSAYKSVNNSIKDEIAMLEYYIKIQKIRYEDELTYTIEIDPYTADFTIPKFILQPLAENAIKYGMLTSSIPMDLTVKVERAAEGIQIKIINSGKLVASSGEMHANHGMANTRTRLDLMFPGKSKLLLSEKEGKVTAEIIILNH